MNPCPPVAQFLAVALAAEAVGLLEGDPLAAGKMEPVAVVGIVAIQAPAVLLVVPQLDVGVHVGEGPASAIRL
jgi:hypothetical protein